MASGSWRPDVWMRSPVEIDMPHATTLAGKHDFILVLDHMHAARVRVHQERAVAAADSTKTRLCDDDVGHAFGIGGGGLVDDLAAAATTAAASTTPATTGTDARQELRGRNDAAQSVEASDAVGIEPNPVPFQSRLRCLCIGHGRSRCT